METNELRALFDEFINGGVDADEMAKALGYNPSLGQLIGKVVDNFTITNDAGDKVQLKLTFDFTTSTDADIKSWLCGNRRIALQRPARAMSENELKSMNNTTVMAIDAGKKVKTKAERIKEAQAIIAALKANFPKEYANMVSEMNVEEDTTDVEDVEFRNSIKDLDDELERETSEE